MTNYDVSQHMHGGQGQGGGPQVPPLGHRDCKPWGYVAPVVAAVMTRANGLRHIYLIVHAIPATVRVWPYSLLTAMFINGDIGREWKIQSYIKTKPRSERAM